MKDAPKPPVIVLGAPRSGTSLVAGALHECGISMGTDFLESDPGNPLGYFEDLDFIHFHQKLLDRSADSAKRLLEDSTMREQPFDFEADTEDLDTARDLIQRRNNTPSTWGWKDPRTCLFLDFWKRLLPDARYIVCYKHPLEMSASLLRMGKNWDLSLDPTMAVRSWTFYMGEVLEHIRRTPGEQCFIANAGTLISDPSRLINQLQHWGLNSIESAAFTAHIDPDLTTRSLVSKNIGEQFSHFFPDAARVFEELQSTSLQAMEWLPQSEDEPESRAATTDSMDSATALACLQNQIQPTAAGKNNRARDSLRQAVNQSLQNRFAFEKELQDHFDSLTQAYQGEKAQRLAQTTQLDQLSAHTKNLKQFNEAIKATVTEQKRELKRLKLRLAQARELSDIIEKIAEPAPTFDLFGRRLSSSSPGPRSHIQKWQQNRATLKDWAEIRNKTKSGQTWIVDLFSLLQDSSGTENDLLNSHWESIAQDVSEHGPLGVVDPRIIQKIFASLQTEYRNKYPQALRIPFDHTYNELAAMFRMPSTAPATWMQHRRSTLGRNLQVSGAFKEWLECVIEKGARWVCSGFHGLNHETLVSLIGELALPTPSLCLSADSIPAEATAQQYFEQWLTAIDQDDRNKLMWLGTSVDRDYHWPRQSGIRHCYLLKTSTKTLSDSIAG